MLSKRASSHVFGKLVDNDICLKKICQNQKIKLAIIFEI